VKQIRVAVLSSNNFFRVEHILNDARIPFKLITQADDHLLIDVENQFLQPTLDALHRAGFTATGLNGNAGAEG
jgi:hypothetical protein